MVYCQQIKWFSQFRFLRFQSRDGRGSIFGRAKAKICKLEPASHPLNLKLPGLTLLHSPIHLSSPRPCFLPTKLHSIARRLLQTGDSVEVAIAGVQCCQSGSLNSWSWEVAQCLFALTVKIVKHDYCIPFCYSINGTVWKICGAGQNSAKNNKFFSNRFSEKRIFANGVRVHPCSTAQKRQPKRLKVLTLKTSKSLVQEKQCYLI